MFQGQSSSVFELISVINSLLTLSVLLVRSQISQDWVLKGKQKEVIAVKFGYPYSRHSQSLNLPTDPWQNCFLQPWILTALLKGLGKAEGIKKKSINKSRMERHNRENLDLSSKLWGNPIWIYNLLTSCLQQRSTLQTPGAPSSCCCIYLSPAAPRGAHTAAGAQILPRAPSSPENTTDTELLLAEQQQGRRQDGLRQEKVKPAPNLSSSTHTFLSSLPNPQPQEFLWMWPNPTILHKAQQGWIFMDGFVDV